MLSKNLSPDLRLRLRRNVLNDGNISFSHSSPARLGDFIVGGMIALVDSDNAADPDVLTNNLNNNTLILVRYNSGTSLSFIRAFPTGLLPVGIATGDFDGDGDFDAVTADANTISVITHCTVP